MSRRRSENARVVHHMFSAIDAGAAVVSLSLIADGLITFASNTANPCAPSAMRLRRIGISAGCLVVNSAGDWTIRIRVNESGSDSATFGFAFAALPGSKTAGAWSSEVVLQAGDTYHLTADGPSRNYAIIRPILEWEIL